MARWVGIDIRASHVRAVLLRTSYRKVAIEQMLEVSLAEVADLDAALRAVALPLTQQGEPISIAVEGEQAFIHRLTLPTTALKQLAEVLPFEIEANVPVSLDDLVYDHRLLRRGPKSEQVVVMAAAARTEHVRARIDQIKATLGNEPERVGAGTLPLANLASLCPALAGPGPVGVVDLGGNRTEIVLLSHGEPVFARTLSRGVAGLPESATALAAELRQTFVAWLAQGGDPVEGIFLVGAGAHAPGAENYLAHELGIVVRQLPGLNFDHITPDQAANVPRFAKAIALALGVAGRGHDLDLRRGPLSFQRGFGFLKEKIPLLTGLAAAVLISFAFSTWAEMRALSRDEETLTKALSTLTKEVLGQPAETAEEAQNALNRAKTLEEKDPMPHMDAYDAIVELSSAVPMSITHDIEEFDLQRGHLKLNGVVSSKQDAQQIATALKDVKCFEDVKIAKVTQVVNSDRQKYVLELDVRCPEDAPKKKKKKSGSGDEPSKEESGK